MNDHVFPAAAAPTPPGRATVAKNARKPEVGGGELCARGSGWTAIARDQHEDEPWAPSTTPHGTRKAITCRHTVGRAFRRGWTLKFLTGLIESGLAKTANLHFSSLKFCWVYNTFKELIQPKKLLKDSFWDWENPKTSLNATLLVAKNSGKYYELKKN